MITNIFSIDLEDYIHPTEAQPYVQGDWEDLPARIDEGRQFDLIVLDPPKFADSRGQLQRALRGYKDINWLAFRLLRPGGILFTFSC